MNLGIERDVTGDIWTGENCAYVFVHEKISDYIIENLSRIKHTVVVCRKTDLIPDEIKPKYEQKALIVPSLRLDAVLSRLYNLSRSETKALFVKNKKRSFIEVLGSKLLWSGGFNA